MEYRYGSSVSHEVVDAALARHAARQHGVVTWSDALRLGATPRIIHRRVANGNWVAVYRGVYVLAGVPGSWKQSLLAACLSAGEGAVASHRASGGLSRLAGVEPGTMELSVPRGRRVRRPGLIVHEITNVAPVDVAIIDGIPSTAPTRTLLDLAAVVSQNVVEEALDDAIRRRLTSIARIRWRAEQLGPRSGSAMIRQLLDERSRSAEIPQSVLETRLLRLLKRSGLPVPICQYQVRDDKGRLLAIVDFAYPDVRLAIEADGYRWHSGRARWEHDLARRNALTKLGLRVIHVTARDLEHHAEDLIQTVGEALSRTATRSRPRIST